MRKYFGTDGIRGVANKHPITPEFALKLGRAASMIFRKHDGSPHHKKIIIGKDTRISGYMLEEALTAGISSMGVDAYLLGPIPTPAIAFLTVSMRAEAGIVISASHNPFEDNGIKFFSRDGYKLPDRIEEEMEALLESDHLDEMRPTAADIGKAFRIEDAQGRYIVFAKSTFPKELTLEGLTIVVDCANGAAYKVAPAIFEELGATVYPISNKPNGMNINAGCGALHPENLSRTVKLKKADIGIGLDGDADRLIVVDGDGATLDGDHVMAIAALAMKEQGALVKNTLVATVMSNFGMLKAMKGHGIKVLTTDVGDRYIMERMLKGKYNLGGEQSGHLIFSDYNTTGDGIVSALQLMRVMVEKKKTLAQLSRVFTTCPQIMTALRVPVKIPLESNKKAMAIIESASKALGATGRVLVRYSGTEPKLRIMVEGENTDKIRTIADDLSARLGTLLKAVK